MVVTDSEFLLVDPDKEKIGWGVVHFISFLQVYFCVYVVLNVCYSFVGRGCIN